MTLVRAEIRENLRLAGPIALGQLGMMAMGIVDTALVGRVSENELAGVALGNNLIYALMMPALGVSLAIEPVASQAIGAGDHRAARASLRAGLALAAALSFPVALLAFASLAILPILKVDPQAIPVAHRYVLSRLPSLLPYFVFLAAKTYQQAAQRPRAAVEAVIVANVAHAAVGYVAVFGKFGLPALGGVGAGVATSTSSLLMMTWVLLRGREKALEPEDDRPLAPIAKNLLRLGIPIGLQLAAEVGIFALVALLMGRLGGRAVAAHQIAIGLASVSFMSALGIAQATSVRVGTYIGAGDQQAAQRAGWIGIMLGVMVMGVSAVVFATMPRLLARAFTTQEEVIAASSALIQIAAFFQLADGAQVVSAGALRGAADTRFPLVANVIVHWGVGLPLAWLCGFTLGWGARGLWVGLTAGLILIAISLVARFRVVSARPLARLETL
jgi:MATE family multidrug resistance protein